jgi:hypothetical protein
MALTDAQWGASLLAWSVLVFMAIFEVAESDAGKIAFQAAPVVVSPVNFLIESSTIFASTSGATARLDADPVTAALLKLITTLPGHLFVGLGPVGPEVAANTFGVGPVNVIPAAAAAAVLRKFLRCMEVFAAIAESFLGTGYRFLDGLFCI